MPASSRFVLHASEPEDTDSLADLWVESWQKTMPEIDFTTRRPWFLGHFASLRDQGSACLVARDTLDAAHAEETHAGAYAGFVLVDPATRYLDQLAVAPAYWGRGAAELLMAGAKEISPAGVTLDVNQENGRAVAFYTRLGFVITQQGRNVTSGRLIWRMEWTPGAA